MRLIIKGQSSLRIRTGQDAKDMAIGGSYSNLPMEGEGTGEETF